MEDEPMTAEEVVDRLAPESGQEVVTFEDLLERFGQRAFGPLLLIPAVIVLLPTGAIPGVSIAAGTIIFLISAQMLMGRATPWLPKRLLKFSFNAEKVAKNSDVAARYAARIDKWIGPRLMVFVEPPFVRIVAAACMVMAALMYPLALIPFAVTAPALTIAVFALGLIASDGLLVLIGFATAVAAVGLGVYLVI